MKKIFAITMMLMVAIFLVACGPSDGRTKIVFWHTMGKTDDPKLGGTALLDKFIDEWEALPENKDFQIVHVSKGGYGELNSAVGRALTAGNEPHMTYSYNDHVAGYLRTKRVQELDSLINHPEYGLTEEEIADFVPGFWEEGKTYDNLGTMYSLPYSKSTEVMFYNKSVFDANDLDAPTTWDEVRAVSEALKALPQYADKKFIPMGYDSTDNLFITASAQRNIPYTSYDANGKGVIEFNNPQAIEMVQYFKDLYFDGLFTTKDQLGGTNTSNKFITQEIFMSIGSTGGTKYNIPSDINLFNVGVAPIPQFDIDNPRMIQQGPNINLFIKPESETLAAWRFLKYIISPNQTAQWSQATGYSPVRLSAFESEEFANYLANPTNDKRQQVFAEVLKLASTEANSFFTSVAFDKSAKARQEVGAIFSKAFAARDSDLSDIFRKAYQEVNA